MAGPGQIPGRYNIIIKGKYDTFDHQIPVEDFIERLKDDAVPDKISVVGLEQALEEGDLANKLSRAMDQRANDLEYQGPTIQFVVTDSFHRQGKTYDLRYEDELYSLQKVFGPQLERRDQGDWITSPF